MLRILTDWLSAIFLLFPAPQPTVLPSSLQAVHPLQVFGNLEQGVKQGKIVIHFRYIDREETTLNLVGYNPMMGLVEHVCQYGVGGSSSELFFVKEGVLLDYYSIPPEQRSPAFWGISADPNHCEQPYEILRRKVRDQLFGVLTNTPGSTLPSAEFDIVGTELDKGYIYLGDGSYLVEESASLRFSRTLKGIITHVEMTTDSGEQADLVPACFPLLCPINVLLKSEFIKPMTRMPPFYF